MTRSSSRREWLRVRSRVRAAGAGLALAALVAVTAASTPAATTPALADTQGTVYGTTGQTTWKNYSTVRTLHCLSGRHVSFYPTGLFNGNGSARYLQLRLVNEKGTKVISQTLTWIRPYQDRAFGQYASGTKYRMSARGWNGRSSDNRFDGQIRERIVKTDNPRTC